VYRPLAESFTGKNSQPTLIIVIKPLKKKIKNIAFLPEK